MEVTIYEPEITPNGTVLPRFMLYDGGGYTVNGVRFPVGPTVDGGSLVAYLPGDRAARFEMVTLIAAALAATSADAT